MHNDSIQLGSIILIKIIVIFKNRFNDIKFRHSLSPLFIILLFLCYLRNIFLPFSDFIAYIILLFNDYIIAYDAITV